MINGFGLILAPARADRILAIIARPAFVGEAAFCLWFLVKGVNMEKWNRRQMHSAREVQSHSTAEASI